MIIHREGDLFESQDLHALAHGCNRQGAMGAGIAVQFKTRWPRMYFAYKRWCQSGHLALGSMFPWPTHWADRRSEGGIWLEPDLMIYNCITQDIGADAVIEAMIESLIVAAIHANKNNITEIGIPEIGCGIGGLKSENLKSVLELVTQAVPEVTFVVHYL